MPRHVRKRARRARLHDDPDRQHRHRQHDARQSHDVKPAHTPPEVTHGTNKGASPYSAYGRCLSGGAGPPRRAGCAPGLPWYLLSASAVHWYGSRSPAHRRGLPPAPPWEPAGNMSWTRQAAVSADPGKVPVPGPGGLRLRRWNDRAVAGVAVAAFASGFGQFGVVAALGDVARGFGQVNPGATLADQAGLSGTDLGIGLAIMRLASLGALPVTGLADRFGRRMMLLVTVGAGLAMTALAAASPSYWGFVAIFACGRPLLSATNALAQVTAAEQTASRDRARAVALIAAGTAPAPGSSPWCTAWRRARSGSAACSSWRWSPWPCCPCSGAGSPSPTGSPWPQPDPGTRSRCSVPWPGRSGAAWR